MEDGFLNLQDIGYFLFMESQEQPDPADQHYDDTAKIQSAYGGNDGHTYTSI